MLTIQHGCLSSLPCAFTGCGAPPNDKFRHSHFVMYGCTDNHEEDVACHGYVCPTHGKSAITDFGDMGYWHTFCAKCEIEILRTLHSIPVDDGKPVRARRT